MNAGKVPNDVLKRIILNKIKNTRKDVLIRPNIGEDCSAVDFGENACVLSTDPITGAVNEIGRLAVHISCNDIASCGVEPIGLMVTIMAPTYTTENDLETIMSQLCETAASLNVDILGGHTEITDIVNRCVIVSTAIGKAYGRKLVTTAGAKPGDYVVITKSAGIEGTAIIAHDKEKSLQNFLTPEEIINAKSFINDLSVVKEGILAAEFGVNSMHDVTEGGILGAAWEVSEASGAGIIIENKKIPLEPVTLKISEYYNIDPLKLISSGCMLITCKDGEGLVKRLNINNIKASIIGRITGVKDKILVDGNRNIEITAPDADELYKVF